MKSIWWFINSLCLIVAPGVLAGETKSPLPQKLAPRMPISAPKLTTQPPADGLYFPEEVLRCGTDADCVGVPASCNDWVAVNRQHEGAVSRSSCRVSQTATPVVVCRQNLCETGGAKPMAAVRVSFWNDQCQTKKVDLLINDLDDDVRQLAEKLVSPLGWERRAAVSELGRIGRRAQKVSLFLSSRLKDREILLNPGEAKCVLGELPPDHEIIRAVGLMDPEGNPALQIYGDWLRDKKQIYRHAELLKQLQKVGPLASPLLPQVADFVATALKSDEASETSLAALETLGTMGSAAKEQLPTLLIWLKKSKILKSRVFLVMMKVDSQHEATREASYELLEQKVDLGARTLALHFLAGFPEEVAKNFELIKKILKSNELSSYRMGALRAAQSLGKKAKPLIPDVVKLALESSEDLRRQAALTLRSIDPSGKHSLAALKKKVYGGFPFEAQYVWKVLDSPITKVELLKSYFYYVTGKRVKFESLKISAASEKEFLRCLEQESCSGRASAIAALTLVKSNSLKVRELLVKALASEDVRLQAEASGAMLILFSERESSSAETEAVGTHLKRAWEIQAEALRVEGGGRLIDLEDILLSLGSVSDDISKEILKKIQNSASLEALDGLLLLASKDLPSALAFLKTSMSSGDKQKIVSILARMQLTRVFDLKSLAALVDPLIDHSEPAVQEAAMIDKLNLKAM
ncbi:MAG: hypothetical protein RJB66_1652 [Pseudomonadota bacterium]